MSDNQSQAPGTPPFRGARWEENPSRQPPELRWAPEEATPLRRFLGGSPGAVFLRLLFVSLIVGAFLMWLDIRPEDIFRGIVQAIDRIWALGFDAVREVINYIIVGAMLVVPIWLAVRLLSMRGR